MFTGIVEETGRVEAFDVLPAGACIRIRCQAVLDDLFAGASVAVNGVCLTAVDIRGGGFSADVAPETLSRSNLGRLRAGAGVNLERPVSPTGRLGGHIVQGHVDGTAEFASLEEVGGGGWWLRVRVPEQLERYLVEKGSVALDGVSLTIAAIEGDDLACAIIPHTFANTTLGRYRPGERINIECDILAKHVEKLLQRFEKTSSLSMDKLRDLGF